MTDLQANPNNMQEYVDARGQREFLAAVTDAVRTRQNAVARACGQYAVDAPGLASVKTWTGENGLSNENFVKFIRQALLNADRGYTGGTVTMDATGLEDQLRAAGLLDPPPPIEVPESTFLGIPQTSGFSDDPINAFNGNFVHLETDLPMPGLAGPLGFTRSYNSLRHTMATGFGPGWSSILDVALELNAGIMSVSLADGAIGNCFVPTEAQPVGMIGRNDYRLFAHPDGFSLVHDPDNVTWWFNRAGEFTRLTHGAATVTAQREGGRIVRLDEAASGRSITIEWDGDRVARLTASDGRVTTFSYNAAGALVATDGPGVSYRYTMRGGLMTEIHDADDVLVVATAFDDDGRVLQQRSQFGRVTTYDYLEGGLTRITGDDGVANSYVHDEYANLIEMTDGLGATATANYDENGFIVSSADRMGFMTFFTRDERGRVTKIVDPDGGVRRFAWDELGRCVIAWDQTDAATHFEYVGTATHPVRVVDPLGGVLTNVLDERGLIVETVDADGVRFTFAYDADGQLTEVHNATGRVAGFEYDAAGHLVASTDASGMRNALTVDAAGLVTQWRRGDAVATYAYSAAGRIRTGNEFGGVAWELTTGSRGEVAAFTDATGASVALAYDTCGNVTQITAADGAVYPRSYDALGQLVTLGLPDGGELHQEFNANGEQIGVIDAAGHAARRTVDAMGRTRVITDQTGRTFEYHYTATGAIESLTLPDGTVRRIGFDAAGRETAWIAADGAVIGREFTPAGRLAAIVMPSGAREEFIYDDAGRCVQVRRGDAVTTITADEQARIVEMTVDHERSFVRWGPSGVEVVGTPTRSIECTYFADGNLREVRDAGGVANAFAFDPRGFLASIVDGDNLATSLTYDVRGRMLSEAFANDRVRSYTYDPLGFLAGVTDSGAATTFEHDRSGFLTGLRHGDGRGWLLDLDAGGRELTRTDLDGNLVRTLRYDDAGRCTFVEAANGDTVEFEWTVNGQLCAQRGGALPFEATYDADGVLVASTSALYLAAEPTTDVVVRGDDGRIVCDTFGRAFTYDALGRLATVDDADGQTRFEYGPDGLLRAEHGPAGSRRYAYDPLGRLTTLTLDADVVHYAYDDAGRRIRDTHEHGTVIEYLWDPLGDLSGFVRTDPDGTMHAHSLTRDPLRVVYGAARRITGADRDVWGLPSDAAEDGWWDGGYWTAHLGVFAARAYDAHARQWLSPDPLATVPGTPGACSAYTYNYFDPVNFRDPSGMRPLSQAEYEDWKAKQRGGVVSAVTDWVGDRWDNVVSVAQNVGSWAKDHWKEIVVAAVVVGLSVATFGVGGVAAGAVVGGLMSGGVSAGMQYATTGHVDWGEVGSATLQGVAIGAVTGGAGGQVGGLLARVVPEAAGTVPALSLGTKAGVSAVAAGGVDAAWQQVTRGEVNWTHVGVTGGLAFVSTGLVESGPAQTRVINPIAEGATLKLQYLRTRLPQLFPSVSSGTAQNVVESAFGSTIRNVPPAIGEFFGNTIQGGLGSLIGI